MQPGARGLGSGAWDMEHGAWGMAHGVGGIEPRLRKLGAGSSKLGGEGFGGPAKLIGRRPVLPMESRPNGAAVFQPTASAAPPWVNAAPHFIFEHPSKHLRARPHRRRPEPRHAQPKAASQPPHPKRCCDSLDACRSAERMIGVGMAGLAPPLPPNRTSGSPASGSPVSGVSARLTISTRAMFQTK